MSLKFLLCFTKYLLFELIYDFVYNAYSLCFIIYVIKRIELVSINIFIDKLVFHYWQYCLNYMCLLDDMCQRIYLIFYKKLWTFSNSYWPWFNLNYTIWKIDVFTLMLLLKLHHDFSILKSLDKTQFFYYVFVFYHKNQL